MVKNAIQELIANHEDTQTKTMMLSQNLVQGELNEILGKEPVEKEFEYDKKDYRR